MKTIAKIFFISSILLYCPNVQAQHYSEEADIFAQQQSLQAYKRAYNILNIGLENRIQRKTNHQKKQNTSDNKLISAIPINRSDEEMKLDYVNYGYDNQNPYQASFKRYQKDIERIRAGQALNNQYILNTLTLMNGKKRILK